MLQNHSLEELDLGSTKVRLPLPRPTETESPFTLIQAVVSRSPDSVFPVVPFTSKAGLATCKSLAYVLEPRNGASSSLARLGLTDNPLGCNGAAVLLRAVAQPWCRLEELALEQASFLDVSCCCCCCCC